MKYVKISLFCGLFPASDEHGAAGPLGHMTEPGHLGRERVTIINSQCNSRTVREGTLCTVLT